jgi:hypothetical protein
VAGKQDGCDRGSRTSRRSRPRWKADEKWLVREVIAGYACACPVPDAPMHPAVVVGPFGGTGTTALVASVLGRTGITVDRSLDYWRLATWRTRDPRERPGSSRCAASPPPAPDPPHDRPIAGTVTLMGWGGAPLARSRRVQRSPPLGSVPR